MLVELSNKQVNKFKEFLKNCRLRGFEVPIFLEIMNALEKPINQINQGD